MRVCVCCCLSDGLLMRLFTCWWLVDWVLCAVVLCFVCLFVCLCEVCEVSWHVLACGWVFVCYCVVFVCLCVCVCVHITTVIPTHTLDVHCTLKYIDP